jgi:ATP phosphoribosyltransferase regulatory subunit
LDTPSLRLPAGMRDFAPRAAAARRRIAETLLGVFEGWGFSRVITPAFEYEEVLALGLGADARAAALKFVEPSSGRVVALRPDITPQIARLIATRFRDESGPVRLCYEGTVLRLERGARSQRELIQAGVELAGVPSPEGDAEVMALGAAALAAAGLGAEGFDLTIDLGHLGLMREVLTALEAPADASRALRAAIAKRDPQALSDVLASVTGPRGRATAGKRAVARFVTSLPELTGDPSVLGAARRAAPSRAIERAIVDLQGIVEAVQSRAISARLHVDLGEVRGFDYYTGVRFQAFVSGAAEPVLQGGRYDDLLGRYGRPSPAVGFAIDVEAAAGALEAAHAPSPASSAFDGPGAALPVVSELRRAGRVAAPLLVPMSDAEVAAYASRWGYAEVVNAAGRNGKAHQLPARTSNTRMKG